MAIHLNIDNKSTVKYRMDCFGENSRTDYHIRGCNVTIPDAINSQDDYYYNVGSYGYIRTSDILELRNPFICNNLLMCGSFQNPSIVADSVYYNELIFTRPMIALDRSSVSGYSGERLTLRSDTFSLIDRIYPDLSSKECLCEGIRYSGGIPSVFSGVFDTPNISAQGALERISLLLEPWWDNFSYSSQQYIVSAERLKNCFSNGSQYPAFWEQILKCEYGAYYGIGNLSFQLLSHPLIIRCQVETQSGVIEIADFPYYNYFKYYYIIPFISQDEFNAAYAANYPWPNTVIRDINKYYFNKFE